MESFKIQAGLAGLIALISLVTVLVWPFTRQSSVLVWLLSLVNLAFLVGLGVTLSQSDLLVFFKEISPGVQLLLILPWISALLTAAAIVQTARDPAHLLSSLLPILAGIAFLGFAWYWQLFLRI